MENMELKDYETINLVAKTIEGKRMIFTEDGKMIGKIILTRETQNIEFSRVGMSEVLLKVICKTE